MNNICQGKNRVIPFALRALLSPPLQSSLADSQESGERASSLTSDMSWEPVEEKDAKMTLWVPDHAVTHCAGCDLEFWIVRRRHHCRYARILT